MSAAVSAELRAELARRKLSARSMAKQSGIPMSTLQRTLSGTRAVDVEDLYSICEFLGLEPADVIARATEAARVATAASNETEETVPKDVGGPEDDLTQLDEEQLRKRGYDLAAGKDDSADRIDPGGP